MNTCMVCNAQISKRLTSGICKKCSGFLRESYRKGYVKGYKAGGRCQKREKEKR